MQEYSAYLFAWLEMTEAGVSFTGTWVSSAWRARGQVSYPCTEVSSAHAPLPTWPGVEANPQTIAWLLKIRGK